MPARKRTASQTRWLKEHFDDPFVKEAHKRGLRSRASFKLEELQKKDRLIKFGNIVVDLGAAPGGWSEFAVKCVGEKGRIIACDILPIRPIRGVEFLQGDFRDNEVFKQLYSMIGEGADVVLSDMAPNLSGIAAADAARCLLLNELALEFCLEHLKDNGVFVTKVFQGSGFSQYVETLKKHFKTVLTRKPEASRDTSAEVYMVAKHIKKR